MYCLKTPLINIHLLAMKMTMPCIHTLFYICKHICYSRSLLFYREASVPPLCRVLVNVIFMHPCIRQFTEVSICKFMYSTSIHVLFVQHLSVIIYIIFFCIVTAVN